MAAQKFLGRFLLAALAAAIMSVLPVVTCLAQIPRKSEVLPPEADEALKGFLRTLDNLDADNTTRYAAAFRDLNGDGKPEAIVYLSGNEWCGSGGCNTLILERNGSSWRVVTELTITQLPIRVLKNTSNGWRNIGVWVQGGGIQPGYEAELRFNGKSYPKNPSVPPARRLAERVEGEVVVPGSAVGVPLYPDPSVSQTTPASRSSQVPQPSFNCASAKTPTEKLVCSDVDLAAMDSAMATAYRSALLRLPADQATTLRRQQLEWFKKYARACDAASSDVERRECVVRYLDSHITQLEATAR